MAAPISEQTIDDRVRRYLTGEPLRLIASDHGVTVASVCHTIRRHAPNLCGSRTRGGGPRTDWETTA